MKKVFIVLCFLVLLSTSVNAFELEVRGTKMTYNDEETKSCPGIEARLKIDDLYGYLSAENRIMLYGDRTRLDGVGIGFNYPISKELHLWGQVGYYMLDYDENRFPWEPLWFYQNKYLHGVFEPVLWPRYVANWKDDFGGEIGIDYKRRIYRVMLIGLSLSYRYLNLNEMTTSYQTNGKIAWLVEQNRDFGGFKVGFQIAVPFLILLPNTFSVLP